MYCDFHVKQGQNWLKIGTWGIFELGRSNMTSVFEIDQNFINYSYMMTYCEFHVKQGQNTPKICIRGISELGRSNMTSVFEIDLNFINYSYQIHNDWHECPVQNLPYLFGWLVSTFRVVFRLTSF